MLRRTEEPVEIVTNYAGLAHELSNSVANSTAVLLNVQEKCQARLRALAASAAAAAPTAISRGSSFDELHPIAASASAYMSCLPQSPISFPSLKRPAPFQ